MSQNLTFDGPFGLGEIENVDFSKFIKDIENNPQLWKTSQTTGLSGESVTSEHRTSDSFFLSQFTSDPLMLTWDNLFSKLCNDAVKQYAEHMGVLVNADSGFSVLRYNDGSYYKTHVDAAQRGPTSSRVVSVVLFLNSNFTGGELDFTYQKQEFAPSTGKILVFPSNFAFAHQSKPVSSGTKYSLVSFYSFHPAA